MSLSMFKKGKEGYRHDNINSNKNSLLCKRFFHSSKRHLFFDEIITFVSHHCCVCSENASDAENVVNDSLDEVSPLPTETTPLIKNNSSNYEATSSDLSPNISNKSSQENFKFTENSNSQTKASGNIYEASSSSSSSSSSSTNQSQLSRSAPMSIKVPSREHVRILQPQNLADPSSLKVGSLYDNIHKSGDSERFIRLDKKVERETLSVVQEEDES